MAGEKQRQPLVISGAEQGYELVRTIQELLAKRSPEAKIVQNLQSLGLDEASARKMLVLSQSNILHEYRGELEKMTAKNAGEQLAKIEAMILATGKNKELLERMGKASAKAISRHAALSALLGKMNLYNIAKMLLKREYPEKDAVNILADLYVDREFAEKLVKLTKLSMKKEANRKKVEKIITPEFQRKIVEIENQLSSVEELHALKQKLSKLTEKSEKRHSDLCNFVEGISSDIKKIRSSPEYRKALLRDKDAVKAMKMRKLSESVSRMRAQKEDY